MLLPFPPMRPLAWLAALTALALTAAPAPAATFTVTRTDDGADGSCNADCSLRDAVIAANASDGPDTILLPAGRYDLTIRDAEIGFDESAAATGDLDVAGGGLTLEGAGADVTEIDATGLDNRIFHVRQNFSSSPIALRGVKLEGGDASALGTFSTDGGALRVDDAIEELVVTLEDVVVSGNGGPSAVYSVGTLAILDSTFERNATARALELRTSNVSKTFASGSATRIERTTFRQNDGYALISLKNENRAHQVEIVNSTFSGNHAVSPSDLDAAILTSNDMRIWNSTIADEGAYGVGAVRDVFLAAPLVEIQSSIFAGNALGSVMPPSATNGATLPVSRGGNVVDDDGAGAFTEATDQVSTSPQILALADNGGLTLTYDLAPGSPAIDRGQDAGAIGPCPATDQRGAARPFDGDGNGVPTCDAGAVEFVPEPAAGLLGFAALAMLGGCRRRREVDRPPVASAR